MKGALPALKKLGLASNQIGDAGISSLAVALGKGALPKLEFLALNENQIGDVGMAAFAAAIAMGCSRHAWARLMALVATVLVCVSLAAISSSWLSTYERQCEISSKISAQLEVKGATATPAAPLAVTGLPALPLFHPKVWGLLGLVPFA